MNPIINKQSSEIQAILFSHHFQRNKSLFGGEIGQALYFSIMGNLLEKEQYIDKSIDLFSSLLEYYNNNNYNEPKTNSFFTYCSGLSGLGVSLNYLVKKKYIDFEINDFNSNLQGILYEKAIYDLGKNNHDFLHGAIGIGLYLLETDFQKKNVEEFVHTLNKIKISDDENKIHWREYNKYDENKYIVNLSLAHGISSIIIFLCRVYEKGICQNLCEELARKCVNYLISKKQNILDYGHYFPNIIMDNQPKGGQLSWCYGEMGVGFALKKYAYVFKNTEIENLAFTIFSYNANKTTIDITRPLDAAICHGSAGLMMMFNRLYLDYNNEIFRNAAKYWYQYTIDFAKFEDGVAGYMAYNGNSKKFDNKIYGLLDGVMGIDLALKTFEHNANQDWDSLFLIS